MSLDASLVLLLVLGVIALIACAIYAFFTADAYKE